MHLYLSQWSSAPDSSGPHGQFLRMVFWVKKQTNKQKPHIQQNSKIILKVSKAWELVSFKSKKKAKVADYKFCNRRCPLDCIFFKNGNCFWYYMFKQTFIHVKNSCIIPSGILKTQVDYSLIVKEWKHF